ncbi:uncharacterized protein G2W53_002627 [Senna tora]|uniref:Uncharacterized protein n=1 Tax=Senna tora TaxID=362788 RepID=A0A835CFJ9_9FABA|nr:uncharacterized protein G2W53_002627 [Senna tora]
MEAVRVQEHQTQSPTQLLSRPNFKKKDPNRIGRVPMSEDPTPTDAIGSRRFRENTKLLFTSLTNSLTLWFALLLILTCLWALF